MKRITKQSKENLIVADRIELDLNSIFQSYHVRIFRGDRLSYLSDKDGVMSFESAPAALAKVKRYRPDLV